MKKENLVASLLLFSLIVPFFWFLQYHQQDLWWDEIISLKDFSLVSFQETRTKYPDPNNHVFFNLIQNLFTQVLAERDKYYWMYHPTLLRGFQFLFSLGAILFTFLSGKRFFSLRVGVISALILSTSIAFLNFSMQLRGYGMSVFFFAVILYLTGLFLENPKLKKGMLIALVSGLFLYTIPSNIYFLFVIGLLAAFNGYKKKPFGGLKGLFNTPEIKLGMWLLGGLVLAMLLYAPVLDQVLNNRFTEKKPPHLGFAITHLFWPVFYSFLSWRLLLLVPLTLLFSKKTRSLVPLSGDSSHPLNLKFLLLLIAIPFLVVFVQNVKPFERTFIPLVIPLALSFGIMVDVGIKKWFPEKYQWISMLGLALYLIGNFFWQFESIQRKLEKGREEMEKIQDSYANYYLDKDFTPGEINEFASQHQMHAPGILLFFDELDRVSVCYYAKAWGMDNFSLEFIRKQVAQENGQYFTHAIGYQRGNPGDEPVVFVDQLIAITNIQVERTKEIRPMIEVAYELTKEGTFYLATTNEQELETVLTQHFTGHGPIEKLGKKGGYTLYKMRMPQ